MTDYDTMDVEWLLSELVDAPHWKRVQLHPIIRRAVIREASVGVGTVRRAGDAPLPEAPQMFVPWETKDGDYDLIPRETP